MRAIAMIFRVILAVLVASASAQAASVSLVPLATALAAAPSARAMLAKESLSAGGPDLAEGSTLPDAVAAYGGGKLFYALFNTFHDADSPRAYAIQRIRKTVTNYRSVNDTQPIVSVDYLVEVFKLRGGALKREDLHHGTYPLGVFDHRVVTKEMEVGTGEIAGVATGDAWPFEPGILYKLVQDYGRERAVFDAVKFDRSVPWKIEASLGANGTYEVRSVELGVMLRGP